VMSLRIERQPRWWPSLRRRCRPWSSAPPAW
jgi:hypothetical protein